MPSFNKKIYTEPVICKHGKDVSKDWYVFFSFKSSDKEHKFKRREGINRIKSLSGRLKAIRELREDISYDLKHGWNPLLDPKRQNYYNLHLEHNKPPESAPHKRTSKQEEFEARVNYYLNKH